MNTCGIGYSCVSGGDDLHQQRWQDGWKHMWTTFCGASQVPSRDFQGESLRSGLHLLYVAVALLKALFWKLGLSLG
jgi:hypothetical protein